jgi:hypothetical protein
MKYAYEKRFLYQHRKLIIRNISDISSGPEEMGLEVAGL